MTPPPPTEPIRPGRLFLLAAAFAAAELAAGLLIGGFFAWGRAEALLFFAFSPWLLLVLALIVAHRGWRARASAYLLALAVAGAAEALLVLALGGEPWIETVRGWTAGALIVGLFDLLIQLGRRVGGRIGQSAAALAAVLLLVVPGALRPYESLALGPTAPREAEAKPPLLLMTGLPIVWGEAGPLDPAGRPAAAYVALQREFTIRPLDYLDDSTLPAGGLMLLAQPRLLEPSELVALDRWVRGGGKVLVLTDPDLVWPTDLPLGDVRRPPPTGLLSPLLTHWGLRLEAPSRRRVALEPVRDAGQLRRLAMAAPGRFVATGESCRIGRADFTAVCRVGEGEAWLVADADLMHDVLWTAPMARGTERHARIADNPLVVASWLDRLGGIERERAAREVRWVAPDADRRLALVLAALPILAALAAAFLLRR